MEHLGRSLGLPAGGLDRLCHRVAPVPPRALRVRDAARPVLRINHEHASRADNEMIDVGRGARDTQIVEDLEAVLGQPVEPGAEPFFAFGPFAPDASVDCRRPQNSIAKARVATTARTIPSQLASPPAMIALGPGVDVPVADLVVRPWWARWLTRTIANRTTPYTTGPMRTTTGIDTGGRGAWPHGPRPCAARTPGVRNPRLDLPWSPRFDDQNLTVRV